MDDQYSQRSLADFDVVRSTQFVDELSRSLFRVAHAQPQMVEQSQMLHMPFSTPYHQQQTPIPWQTTQPVFGSIGGRSQSMYNPCLGTPVAAPNAYTNQVSYPPQAREGGVDGTPSGHMQVPLHNRPQCAPFGSPPVQMVAPEYYSTGHPTNSAPEHSQVRTRTRSIPTQVAEGDKVAGVHTGYGQGSYDQQRETHSTRDARGSREGSNSLRGAESARQDTSTLGPSVAHPVASSHTTSEGGALREHRHSMKEPSPVNHTNNSPTLLSTTSSKSSPPSTLSQRKQLRVEEKYYLKEVKRSIAEGRVPQVRLQQSNNGAIVQYKAQFLNALKLAALAIVPHADIDIKNPCTMQEIMKEVKRQFIIEKPLPEGMVEGYLQRLYKRNRGVYHRHWLLHGDDSKPDDCASAAWLQLVDYWKSSEGSRECERNKANASSKRAAAVKNKSAGKDRRPASGSEGHTHAVEKGHPSKHQDSAIRPMTQTNRTPPSSNSKISSSSGLVERTPMSDISNKLHALVDEFVSNLSSECGSLANNVSAEAHVHVAHDSALVDAQTQRPNNRTTSEVLKGLRRPSPSPNTSSHNKEGKSHVNHAQSSLMTGNTNNSEEGKNLRFIKDTKARIAALKESGEPERVKSVNYDIEELLLRDLENHGDSKIHNKLKKRHMQTVELLSSDSASDESSPPRAKPSARRREGKHSTKRRESTSQGRSRRKERRSPSRSPSSAHSMDYSYEDDTPDIGGTSPHNETRFAKLRWPSDSGASHEDGVKGTKNDIDDGPSNTVYRPKRERKKAVVDTSGEEGDESNGEDLGRNPAESESEAEELPVLPKIAVKRKESNQPKTAEKRTQRGITKSTSPQTKKQRTPQIDASVITQLQFSRRPPNCAPIRVRVKVWVLHPRFEGKVVAEAYAGINHKSRCINDEQDLCKKGEQLISVIRVFYKDTPVMFKKDGRYPKHIAFLDQAEGLPNSPILWGVCYLVQIPSMEEITRMMGNVTSVVCGKASPNTFDEGHQGRTSNSFGTRTESLEAAKMRDTVQSRNKFEKTKAHSKKVS